MTSPLVPSNKAWPAALHRIEHRIELGVVDAAAEIEDEGGVEIFSLPFDHRGGVVQGDGNVVDDIDRDIVEVDRATITGVRDRQLAGQVDVLDALDIVGNRNRVMVELSSWVSVNSPSWGSGRF